MDSAPIDLSSHEPRTLSGPELGIAVQGFVRSYLSRRENNNLGPGTSGVAWDDVLIGFSDGADELYGFLKQHIGSFHWTPAEAFALGSAERRAASKDEEDEPRPDELSVISWALCQTESAKAANRRERRMPSEPWARSRIFGQECNRRLHKALTGALGLHGYEAVAPGFLRQWVEESSPHFGRACSWSERHVAYISGLGTFSLSGGLITERGQAVRFGSVVVRARVPATPRSYSDPFAHCLFFAQGTCAACASRCPVGSIGEHGRDKDVCATHLKPMPEPLGGPSGA
jgi:epoxyqueuosine reductase